MQNFVKIVIPKNDIEKDLEFYNVLNYNALAEIVPVYNKIRNYLTKKPYSQEKIKLNFGCPTLLNGWDLNKEEFNLSILLEKEGFYYLGIINKKDNKIFKETKSDSSDNYKKIEYKLLPGPNKMLPKVFFSDKRIKDFAPSAELLERYNKGLHKKEAGDLTFCHELIDFYKKSINKHEDWKNFNFKFTNTIEYQDISQFYKEVTHQGYKITFKNISSKYIDELVESGRLFLFRIYNKDFSKYSKGKENLHTMYWKMLFDEDNLENVIYKLNGEAEIFYRKKSIVSDKVTHPANEPIKNKNILNNKKESVFKYDLIKDKRYTLDKFQFHVPVTLNFKADDIRKFNDYTNLQIKSSDDIHIIGIDRGERNLLYINIIDTKGNIKEQFSLNEIVNEFQNKKYTVNYHDLLAKKEEERDRAKKSWNTIENIKELKEGYMSQVVHKIAQLILKYNAIVVMEDLNSGFKNSRKKVEKSVYDKFEKMLINKLEYLVDKNIQDKHAQGGLLNAYQLANSKIQGRQNGIVFYIPAWNTSKIDPVTGFVDFFHTKYEGIEKSKIFIQKFDDIRYNNKEDYFEFVCNYKNFTDKNLGKQENWTICTFGDRIRTFRNKDKNSSWDSETICLSKEFKSLFQEYSIDMNNIKQSILGRTDKSFYERFIYLFKLTVQLRNSITGTLEDYVLSPIRNKQGTFFDSRTAVNMPQDADSNGAYNIARKGLMILNRIKESNDNKMKIDYAISNADWLNFVQS